MESPHVTPCCHSTREKSRDDRVLGHVSHLGLAEGSHFRWQGGQLKEGKEDFAMFEGEVLPWRKSKIQKKIKSTDNKM